MTNTRTAWTPAENAALVRLYFAMLDCEHRAIPYSKAAMIRIAMGCPNADDRDPSGGWGIAGELTQRSRGSIEAKLMNASAAHGDIVPDAETMAAHGYKAWGNYQATLKTAMADEIERRDIDRLDRQWMKL